MKTKKTNLFRLNGIRKGYLVTLLFIFPFVLDHWLPSQQSTEIYQEEYVKRVTVKRKQSSLRMLVTDKQEWALGNGLVDKSPGRNVDLKGELLHVKKTPIFKTHLGFESEHLKYEVSKAFLYLIWADIVVLLIGGLFFSKGTDKQGVFLFFMMIVTITLLLLLLYS